MIKRYSTSEMTDIWADDHRFRYWLMVEKEVARAEEKLGIIPKGLAECLRDVKQVDAARVAEIEVQTEHEVTAFLQAVWEQAPCSKEYLHYGLTSYDVVDNAQTLRILESLDELEPDIKELNQHLAELAVKHKNTLVLGRTHGRGAEPISFGVRALSWYSEGLRIAEELADTKKKAARGRIGGTVGTFTTLPPAVEEIALAELGLEPEPVSTQVIPRDRHARLVFFMALAGSWLERIAVNIRLGQLEGLDELYEPFKKRQTGSSAMPHKRNPVITERVCGLSRILKSNVQAALENVALWHERDISHSSVERVILTDSFNLIHYLVRKMKGVIRDLKVEADNMKRVLNLTGGTFFAQRLLLALIRKGTARQDAYRMVQRIAFDARDENKSFDLLARGNKEITRLLNEGELNDIFSLERYLSETEVLYKRLNL